MMTLSDVAGHFSRAHDYDCHNQLQRLTAEKLLARATLQGHLLDIGAGPGTDFSLFPVKRVTTVDIAFAMCQRLRSLYPSYGAVCADAATLPFSSGCFDSLYSNLALQWCPDFAGAVDEAARVLKPGGRGHFAMVCDGALPELEALGFCVNHFAPASQMVAAFSEHDWCELSIEVATETLHFDDLRTLLYSIKGVGASARHGAGQAKVLRGRADWLARVDNAERMRTPKGLPLSYEILYVSALKRGATT
ncbi:methyltransferase domain-containing protein [Shewanella litorisediminis]|uniref:Methyltransferase domain-containing protein n=1 Tax=Shewanella litorisediminis TaxID=1173586 RepID=A0ABX7G7A4_9GAMM|nr:methyltransferase domain-containing protein [Shewanella litorisediminis]MCL2916667.1 methyltransferase domain-containing protein [Shewanella litorisediminis]QRH03159.1 methyltransferase domain-containing protein [Shewanella litorisediminis]